MLRIKNRKIALVSHDAGGAEILSSWAKNNFNNKFCFVLQGPAIRIFKKKIGDIEISNLLDAIEHSEIVICGTSWESDLEKNAIIISKLNFKKVISFIDHWVNYIERFKLENIINLPDEIWVGDRYALKIAEELFNNIEIKLVVNPYFSDLISEINNNKTHSNYKYKNGVVLYVCEPIREHALKQYGNENFWGYTEEEALIFFMKNLKSIDINVNKIILRPHPSEKHDKYNWVLSKYKNVEIVSNNTLIEQILNSEIIVGCESMAMVVGLLAKKRVISSIPFGGKKCGLPQNEIEHLQNLITRMS